MKAVKKTSSKAKTCTARYKALVRATMVCKEGRDAIYKDAKNGVEIGALAFAVFCMICAVENLGEAMKEDQ